MSDGHKTLVRSCIFIALEVMAAVDSQPLGHHSTMVLRGLRRTSQHYGNLSPQKLWLQCTGFNGGESCVSFQH